MLTQSLIYLPSIVGVIGIGWFVLARSKQAVFRLFGLFSFSLATWLFFQYLTDAQVGSGRLWLQLASVALSFMAALFLLFVYAYPNHYALPRNKLVIALLPLLVFVPISFTSLLIGDVTYTKEGIEFTAGPLFTLQTVFLVIYMLIGLSILMSRLRRADVTQKSQIYFLITAFMVALLGSVLAGFIFLNSTIWQAARPLSILLMLVIIAYAMTYHRLFDIRAYVVRTVAYSVTLATVALIYAAITLVTTTFFLDSTLSTGTLVYLTGVSVVVAFFFQPLRLYFNKATNKLFFRDYYEPQDVLDRLSSLLVSNVEMVQIKKGSQSILESTLRPSFLRILIAKDSPDDPSLILPVLTQSRLNVFITDNLDRTRYSSLYNKLRKEDIAAAVRLRTTHGDLGFIILGSRQSGVPYSIGDSRLLGVFADELAIGLQNALRFQEIEQFNVTLQEKIDEATKKLRRTNERLRLLDQTKDDFISMASHQLRTPLTSVKGYVSMVLDGDGGKINETQRKLLTQSFLSSQRMVYLISDLLNVSRLKTGKFVIEPVESNLASVIEEELDQLTETVKSRGLELAYHKPEHFPVLMLDETKIRQVIMNFVDNAIYYTPNGGHIRVNLVDKGDSVEFTVVDDGIGVPKHEQHHLFSKFYRAKNAKNARPDGTGLGLFMAKKVVIAQGGAVIFSSAEGKGSTFGFTFPKDKLLPAQPEKAKSTAKA